MKTIILILILYSNYAFSQITNEKKNAKYDEEKVALIDSKQVPRWRERPARALLKIFNAI